MKLNNKTEEKKFAKHLMDRYQLPWEEYLKRFEGTKPIELEVTQLYPNRLAAETVECEIDCLVEIASKFNKKRHNKEFKIIGGFKKKITLKQIQKIPYLSPNIYGLNLIIHKDVIEIMEKTCPDDFEAIKITLISQHPDVEPFECKDFYAINVLKCIAAVDRDQSEIKINQFGDENLKKLYYKENPWQDGCRFYKIETPDDPYAKRKSIPEYYQLDKPCMLGIDSLTGVIVWHPKLVKLSSSSLPLVCYRRKH